jgi:Protein of unknown function (DUF4235)
MDHRWVGALAKRRIESSPPLRVGSAVMKILYKPFAIIAGIISTRLGRSVFKQLWATIDEDEPPGPRTADANMTKVIGAAALKAATMASVAAAVDRASARWFHYLTGSWPGDERPEKSEEE